MEEKAQAFADFLACTEGVSELTYPHVMIERFADHINVSLEGGVHLSTYEPDNTDNPRFSGYFSPGSREINEPEWLARFIRTASQVIIEPDGEDSERITLVFRDE